MGNPRYLSDPEESDYGSDLSSEPVKAATKDDAEGLCKDKANDYGVELVDVESRGGSWWDCIFGGEQR